MTKIRMMRIHRFGDPDVLQADEVELSLPVRALRYTVEADGNELAEIASLVTAGKVKPHVEKTYPLDQASQALAAVEKNHPVGKIVLTAN